MVERAAISTTPRRVERAQVLGERPRAPRRGSGRGSSASHALCGLDQQAGPLVRIGRPEEAHRQRLARPARRAVAAQRAARSPPPRASPGGRRRSSPPGSRRSTSVRLHRLRHRQADVDAAPKPRSDLGQPLPVAAAVAGCRRMWRRRRRGRPGRGTARAAPCRGSRAGRPASSYASRSASGCRGRRISSISAAPRLCRLWKCTTSGRCAVERLGECPGDGRIVDLALRVARGRAGRAGRLCTPIRRTPSSYQRAHGVGSAHRRCVRPRRGTPSRPSLAGQAPSRRAGARWCRRRNRCSRTRSA